MEIKSKTEYEIFLRKLLKEWLAKRGFTGEFKFFYPKTDGESFKVELYYDENNSEKLTKRLSKELCQK